MELTEEQIVALAPDTQVASSGKKLSSIKSWSNLGSNHRAVWGECAGSGSKPYQVRVDRASYSAKCSCPSRKFPCKHAIGLLLLVGAQPHIAAENPEPEWVAEWLGKRTATQEQKQQRAQRPTAENSHTQQKRQEKRESRIDEGLHVLTLWLSDIMRRGIAQLPAEGYSLWEGQAARMVDAQAPGIAARLRTIGEQISVGDNWPARTLDQLGEIALLIHAWQRKSELPQALLEELEQQLGFVRQEADVVQNSAPLEDEWQVIGQRTKEWDRLRIRRTWLQGKTTQRFAMLQQTAVNAQPFSGLMPVGTAIQANLHFWPGAYPLRATTNGSQNPSPTPQQLWHSETIDAFLSRHAHALAANPWLPYLPVILADVAPVHDQGQWTLVNSQGQSLPLHFSKPHQAWTWLACQGGKPSAVSGEWEAGAFHPLGFYWNGQFIALED